MENVAPNDPMKQMSLLGCEMEALLPLASAPDGADAVPIGGVLLELRNLATSLRNGDYMTALRSLRNLLNMFLGDSGEINFALGSPEAALDWGRIFDLIKQVLPIILPLILKRAP